jgi:hypothetical protein
MDSHVDEIQFWIKAQSQRLLKLTAYENQKFKLNDKNERLE